MRTLLVLLAACPHAADLPEAICPGANPWAPGERAFVEKTDAWGLRGVAGTRITAVDFDRDGWTDLSVSVAAATEVGDDFSPEGVRKTWLMRNDGAGRFVDVTVSSGFRATRRGAPGAGRPGQTIAWGDVDNDGDVDAYTGLYDPGDAVDDETSEVMLNQGDGTFALAASSPLRMVEHDAPAGATFVDVDRDGLLDLWVGEGDVQQDQLWKGDGTGRFKRITDDVGLTTLDWSEIATLNLALGHTNAWSSLACDVNGDGRPDLLAASYGRAPNHLWLQQPDGTFANRSVLSGYAYDERTDWTDNESARCWCELHPDDVDCAGLPVSVLVCEADDDAFRWDHDFDRNLYRLGGNSGTTVCGDVDNDGDRDLLTTEIVHWDVGASSDPSELLFNDGDGKFERPGAEVTGLTRERGSGWNDGDITAAMFDFDNDGWLDVWIGSTDYPGARGLLWRQDAPGHFVSVDPTDGVDHPRSHGVAVADFDRDGDLDLVVGHSNGRCSGTTDCLPTTDVRMFENRQGGNFVQLHLVGSAGSNRAAIGAKVTIEADGFVQLRDVDGGHGHYGVQHDLVVHAGLGGACDAKVTIRWPDAAGTTETMTLPAGHRYEVVQGQPPTVK